MDIKRLAGLSLVIAPRTVRLFANMPVAAAGGYSGCGVRRRVGRPSPQANPPPISECVAGGRRGTAFALSSLNSAALLARKLSPRVANSPSEPDVAGATEPTMEGRP
jgi:hypothetical protein